MLAGVVWCGAICCAILFCGSCGVVWSAMLCLCGGFSALWPCHAIFIGRPLFDLPDHNYHCSFNVSSAPIPVLYIRLPDHHPRAHTREGVREW